MPGSEYSGVPQLRMPTTCPKGPVPSPRERTVPRAAAALPQVFVPSHWLRPSTGSGRQDGLVPSGTVPRCRGPSRRHFTLRLSRFTVWATLFGQERQLTASSSAEEGRVGPSESSADPVLVSESSWQCPQCFTFMIFLELPHFTPIPA